MVKNINNDYTIDEFGNVYSYKSNKYLKCSTDSDGYYYVTINGKHKKIHRLVAELFVDNPNNKPCIDHIDRNRKNNYYKNLRWVTPKENSNNPETVQYLKTIGAKYKASYGKKVVDSLGNVYISIIEASRATHIPRSNIQYHLKAKTGRWEYV